MIPGPAQRDDGTNPSRHTDPTAGRQCRSNVPGVTTHPKVFCRFDEGGFVWMPGAPALQRGTGSSVVQPIPRVPERPRRARAHAPAVITDTRPHASKCQHQHPDQQHDQRAPQHARQLVGTLLGLGHARQPQVARRQLDRQRDAQRQQDHVVEQAEHRDEVGNQVDRAQRIGQHQHRHQLGQPRRLGVAQQLPQRQQVRGQPGGVGAAQQLAPTAHRADRDGSRRRGAPAYEPPRSGRRWLMRRFCAAPRAPLRGARPVPRARRSPRRRP